MIVRPTPEPTRSSSYGDALPYPENASTLVAAAGAGHRRHPGRATRTSRSRSASSPTSYDRPAPCSCPSRSSGACGCRVFDIDLSGTRGGWKVDGAALRRCSTPTPSTRTRGREGVQAAAPEGRHLRQLGDRHLDRRRCPPRAPGTRTPPLSTSSTTCRPTRSAGPGRHRDAEPAGAVDRGAVQPRGGDPGRAT